MSRGDYVRVLYRTGAGIAEEKVLARTAGATVATEVPTSKVGKAPDPFVTVMEMNKAGEAVRTVRFTTESVVGLIEGHDEPAVATKRAAKGSAK